MLTVALALHSSLTCQHCKQEKTNNYTPFSSLTDEHHSDKHSLIGEGNDLCVIDEVNDLPKGTTKTLGKNVKSLTITEFQWIQ